MKRTGMLVGLLIVLLGQLLGARQVSAQGGGVIFVNDNVGDGLVGHWKFDEGLFNTSRDFAGSSTAGLVATAKIQFTDLAPLTVPNPAALSLDGSNGYAEILSPAGLTASTNFTVTAWIRRIGSNNYDAIYDSGTQANKYWIFLADNGAIAGGGLKANRLGIGKRGINEIYGTYSFTDSNWHHIAVVKSGDAGNNITFYVDGALDGTGALGSVTVPSGIKRIGALLDGSLTAHYNGNLDDVRVYNRALNAAEIVRLAAGQGCSTDGAAWPSAYRELQCALDVAVSGQDIWLAGGVYKPGTNASVAFNLVNGVDLLGGFSGSETAANQRQPFDRALPLTFLSGDVRGDDDPVTFNFKFDNNRHVVIAGSGVSATLEGMRIQSGRTTLPDGNGGGLLIQNGALNMSLINVDFRDNLAETDGGAIHNQASLTLTNVSFFNNRCALGSGGALYTSVPVTLTNNVFTNNRADFGGAISSLGALQITASTFNNNQARFDGGAVFADGPATIAASNFNSNQAGVPADTGNINEGSGGAIFAGGDLALQDTALSNNSAKIHGGAAYVMGTLTMANSPTNANAAGNGGGYFLESGATIQNASVSSNTASQQGGGIFLMNGSLALTNIGLNNNTAVQNGGGLLNIGGTVTLSQGTVSGNSAVDGAGIFNAGTLTSSGVTFNSNTASGVGGAVYNVAAMNDTSSTFSSNSANAGGGVAFRPGDNSTGNGSFQNSIFSGNTALDGGGLHSMNDVSLTNTVFSANSATSTSSSGGGGGIFTSAGVATITGGTFLGNSSAASGGAARLNSAVIRGTTFQNNTATVEGGALRLIMASEITGTTFQSNTGGLSGAILMDGPADRAQTLTIINSLFFDNHCTSTNTPTVAADLRLFDLTLELVNNTFGRPLNSSRTSVNMFRVNGSAGNNIFAGYIRSLHAQDNSNMNEDYNLLFNAPLLGPTPGGHSLNTNPLFVDITTGNFHLQKGSPAIDAGNTAILPASITTDRDGLPRQVDNLLSANTGSGTPPVDMGAFEAGGGQVFTFVPLVVR